jgi:hypothetical protein
MEQKDFIEITTSTGVVLVALSSIAMVEPNGKGATIVMKETNKDKVAYTIITGASYYSIRDLLNYRRI